MFTSAASSIAANAAQKPSVVLKTAMAVGDGLFRVVASVVNTPASAEDRNLILKELDQMFAGKLRSVAGSFKVTAGNSALSETITGLVATNHKVVCLTDDNRGAFRAVASNMYIDEEDTMWKLQRTGGGDLLIQSTGVDDVVSVSRMLASMSSVDSFSGQGMVAQASAKELSAGEGSYVAYIDANKQKRFGFVLATVDVEEDGKVVDSGKVLITSDQGEEPEVVDRLAVVDTVPAAELEEPALDDAERVNRSVSAARGSVDVKQMISYYTKVFGHNQAYLNAFIQRIQNHAFCC